jgi:hypothetical protein
MDKASARSYRDRWQAVAAFELAERRTETTADRWRQMAAITSIVVGLGLFERFARAKDVEGVRERWIALKSRTS